MLKFVVFSFVFMTNIIPYKGFLIPADLIMVKQNQLEANNDLQGYMPSSSKFELLYYVDDPLTGAPALATMFGSGNYCILYHSCLFFQECAKITRYLIFFK